MTTDWRALCVDLVAWADYTSAHYYAPPEVLVRAHAALAQPEPEGPTDEEIMGLMPQQMRDDLAAAARALAGFDPDNIKAASAWRIILNRHSIDLARAVLARWGTPNLTETRSSLKDAWAAHQPAIEAAAKAGMDACRVDGPAVPDGREPASVNGEPSDGEVAELVAALRNDAINCTCSTLTSGDLRRAADILEQRQAASIAGWQPIDTAPKDGTEILASDYDVIEIVSWAWDREWETWYWTGRDGQAMHPAWWQPLPDHPLIPITEPQP